MLRRELLLLVGVWVSLVMVGEKGEKKPVKAGYIEES